MFVLGQYSQLIRHAKTRELTGIRAQQIPVELVEVDEELVDERLVSGGSTGLELVERIENQQIAICRVESVPEILLVQIRDWDNCKILVPI